MNDQEKEIVQRNAAAWWNQVTTDICKDVAVAKVLFDQGNPFNTHMEGMTFAQSMGTIAAALKNYNNDPHSTFSLIAALAIASMERVYAEGLNPGGKDAASDRTCDCPACELRRDLEGLMAERSNMANRQDNALSVLMAVLARKPR
jgi:hypothetical protein